MNAKRVLVVLGLMALLGQHAEAYYNATTGRWLSRDPINEAGGRNLYVAVQNHSVNSVDHSGRYEVSLAYKGLTFTHIDQRGSVSESLWAAFLIGFTGTDNSRLGGRGTVLSKFTVGLTMQTCCNEARYSGAKSKFFATPFRFVDQNSGDLVTFEPVSQTTPSLNYAPGAPNHEEYIWINPVLIDISALLVGHMGDLGRGTVGHLLLSWDYQILPSGFPVDPSGFTPPHTGGDGPLLWPETDHTYSTYTQPQEWSTKVNNGHEVLEFSWDSCNKSSRPFGTSFECALPASGLSRLDRWGDVLRIAPYSEYWPGRD